MQKYKIIKTLGEGNFGVVYKATNINTGETVAIKKFKQKYEKWDECIELREVKSLRKLAHPNIIKLKEVLHITSELYLVFEYLDYNIYELYSRHKEQRKKFTQNEIRSIVYQVAEGLAHMHKNGFFHRDMKPENLLIYNNVVKICDYGLARQVRSSPPYTEYVSTRWYRAPELLLRSRNYNSPVDIFALGCIMTELYNQAPLFPGNNETDQMNKIVNILGTPDQTVWSEGHKLAKAKGYYFPQQKGQNLGNLIPDASPEAVDLIQLMLQYPPRKRPTAFEILKHPYFESCKPLNINSPNLKEIVLQSKPDGKPLDTKKEDKKQEILKLTKEKFRLTREEIFKKQQQLDTADNDLDSILKELELKVSQKSKLPMISTKQKFRPGVVELRQSKTQMSNPTSFKPPLHELRRAQVEREKMKIQNDTREIPSKRNQRFTSERKDIPGGQMNGARPKNDLFLNKLSYSFQPLSMQQPATSSLPQSLPKNIGSWPRGLVPTPGSMSLGKTPFGDPLSGKDLLRPRNVELLSKFNKI